MPNRSNWHCDNSCTPRCECNAGYVRNFLGSCIEETECPNPFCPVNEEVSTCYNYCEDLTCDTYNSNLYCPPVAADKCTSRCKCKAGYVRNSDVSKRSIKNYKMLKNITGSLRITSNMSKYMVWLQRQLDHVRQCSL